MSAKKGITLWDVLAHIRGLSVRFDAVDKRFDGLGTRIDGIDGRLDRMEGKIDGIDQRVRRIEDVLQPSFTRLQITVRDHGSRIRKIERKLVLA